MIQFFLFQKIIEMKLFVLSLFFVCYTLSIKAQTINEPEILPTKQQVEWADAEIGVLIHFDMPVFKPEYKWRRDFGKHPDASIFNPTDLNTDQWIKTAKAAGAKYAVLVAKHCSGFSLWPTKAHDYNISKSPYKNGEGDIVKEFIASCKKYGLKPGIYASTTANGYLKVDNPGKVISGDLEEQKRYNKIVQQQLTELWTNYGQLFEIWFDGGILPVEKGGFDILSMVKKYQPQTIAFQGPFGFSNNIRWVGNEHGVAPDPCWACADSTTSASGVIQIKGLHGNPDGRFWCPGEADFPLRKNNSFQGGWFWHEGEDDKLFSLDELMDKYTKSVGRNTNMLLGIVIDNRGLVPDTDVMRLEEFGKKVKKTFLKPIAQTSGNGEKLFELKLNSSKKISFIVIQEDITKGEQIRKFELTGEKNGHWIKIAEGENIGHKRIIKTDNTFTSIKLNIIENSGEIAIRNFACY
jgi:alpha-L-fucosidase